MKKLVTTVLTALFLSFALFAAGMNDTAVVRLHAYVPERTTFTADEFGFSVASNAYNFTYSVAEEGVNRTLIVVAN
jgi:hypothetical protein